MRRSYSICVGVTDYERDGELRVGIKRVRGGRFSNFAFDTLQPGHTVDVMTPDGRFFTHLNAEHGKHYVAFAGGSGITPVLAIIKTTLDLEPRSTFTLIYGNRDIDSIMFAELLEDLKNRYMSRFALYHVLSDDVQEVELFNGVLDEAKCTAFLDVLVPASTVDEAFICGPAPMMDAAERALKAAGVEEARIHVERFGTPLPQAGAPAVEISDQTHAADLEIVLDGKRRKLRLPYEGPSLLDVGLHAGLALPYACKGGVCCTCRAKVLEGDVKMDKNYTLEEQEIRDGFVLTCQCHPLSERVVVSYDER
jgi:ring-1,2-phenylacetyl-CoA epoxidase subunit PaaE